MDVISANDTSLASAATHTPILTMFREWEKLQEEERAVYNASLTGEDEATKAADARMHEQESKLMAARCRVPLDFVAKVIVWTCYGIHPLPDEDEDPDFWANARELISGAV